MLNSDILITLMSLILSGLSSLATIFLGLQLSAIRRIYMREAKATQMERTLRAVQLPTFVIQTMNEVLYSNTKAELNFQNNPKLASNIRETLEFFETLATGILADVYDENIAYSRLVDSFLPFYAISRTFIYEIRSNNSSAGLYLQLDQLARRWGSRERYSQREYYPKA